MGYAPYVGELIDAYDLVSVAVEAGQTIYVTYTKTNAQTGEVYSGRASGIGTPEEVVDRRDATPHHKNSEGFGPAVLDKATTDPQAARGREQLLIEKHGSARSAGGTSGNAINGISSRNQKKATYIKKAIEWFGKVF
ncbi:MAG: hypothetical protein EHM23_00190 [Acidobacteria bacterium]|nr:MAG: hypothetical protein EHM23_00190 [Acidobacteriota bacterium]